MQVDYGYTNMTPSSVDCVWSVLSCRRYARKRVFKGGTAEHAKQAQRRLVAELKALKSLRHHHLVKIVGSYTDTQYIAYIMSPVATWTLGDFLASKKKLGDGDMTMLRRSYGCLAAAVNYLHQNQVRHNDITRRNVLIYKGEVYIADFGSCHRWNTQTPLGSRTRHVTIGVSPDYMAPEIARPDSIHAPKGRAADMWSLGVLFLEMTTRLMGRHLDELQASLRASAAKISKPGFLYANPQFVSEWMETLRRGSRISQHDNEPLQWIRVLLQKTPSMRFTSVTLMNRILDSPSFTEFHCFKCRGEFVNSQQAYQSHGPRFDLEDGSQAIMDTVGDVFGADGDLHEQKPSKKTIDFVERWRSDSAPLFEEYPDENSHDNEERADDDTSSLPSEVESLSFTDEPTHVNDQLLYNLGGLSSVPEYPHESSPHLGPADSTVASRYDDSAYMWGWDRAARSNGPKEEGESPSMESKVLYYPPSSNDSDPTALFDEAESASSNGAEDDVRMFEEISEKSDSGSEASISLEEDPDELSNMDQNKARRSDEQENTQDDSGFRIRAVETGHGLFEEEEEVSESEPEDVPTENNITPDEESIQDVSEVGDKEGATLLESPLDAADAFIGEAETGAKGATLLESPLNAADASAGEAETVETSRNLPDSRIALPEAGEPVEDLGLQARDEQQSDTLITVPKAATSNSTTGPKPTRKVTARSKPKPTVRFDPAIPERVNTDAPTRLNPSKLPTINVQLPEDQPVREARSETANSDTATAGIKPLSKKNLKKMAPKRPKARDPVNQLNPASFLKVTADSASTIATSVISENTKKSITGVGLPIKQADKLKDFLSLHCEKGKAAVVRWLLAEGCNPGTCKNRRAGPITRAVRGCSKRHIKCVGALIQHGVDLNVRTHKSGMTPLQFAIQNKNFDGYEKLIWLLMENGARVDRKSRDGETALMILFLAANERAFEQHHLKALAILLNAGANVNCVLPDTGDSPLHMAVRNKDDWATTMLLHKGADVTAQNASGTTPIQVTANQFRGHLTREHGTVLNIILKYIADKDKKAIDQRAGAQGRTALHHAVTSGTVQAVELLLAYGASPLATDARGHDALHHALTSAPGLTTTRSIEDHVEIMERLAKAACREWPADQGVCALETACVNKKLMGSLLKSGLDPNTRFKGASLLQHASKAGNKGVIEILRNSGASNVGG